MDAAAVGPAPVIGSGKRALFRRSESTAVIEASANGQVTTRELAATARNNLRGSAMASFTAWPPTLAMVKWRRKKRAS